MQQEDDEFYDAEEYLAAMASAPASAMTEVVTHDIIVDQNKPLVSPPPPPKDSDLVLVKNLDSGEVIDADILHEDYKLKSRVGNNPLSDLIYQRTGQSQQALD